ncbi:MAG: hypothetical protein IJX28_02125 [Clostridia bacterium]|nr:hypothetical protein [Clostridia bacterium]
MRKKILICIGVLCLVLLACLPLFLGPLEPLEDEVVIQFDPTTNCFEISYPDGTVESYPVEIKSRMFYYDATIKDTTDSFYAVEQELFFSTFFNEPLRLRSDANATHSNYHIVFSQFFDSSKIHKISLYQMSVNDERLILELPSGEIYVSTDRRFTEEKMSDIFSAAW